MNKAVYRGVMFLLMDAVMETVCKPVFFFCCLISLLSLLLDFPSSTIFSCVFASPFPPPYSSRPPVFVLSFSPLFLCLHPIATISFSVLLSHMTKSVWENTVITEKESVSRL
jgi:hypothetical protein